MLASTPASILNQTSPDSGIPNRLNFNSFRSRSGHEASMNRIFPTTTGECAIIFNQE
jgi:hypothetical protein